MSSYIAGDTILYPFALNDAINGAIDPDVSPTVIVRVNGDVTADIVDITHIETGRYQFSFQAGAAGDLVSIDIAVVVSGKTYLDSAGPWRIDAVRIADPLAADPADYADGSVGALIGKLNVGDPADPVIVVPSPPQDIRRCRLFGYVLDEEGQPAANAAITAELIPATVPAKVEGYPIIRRKVSFTTNSEGRIKSENGELFVELLRTDYILPNTTEWKYSIKCSEAKISVETTLTASTLDISSLIS